MLLLDLEYPNAHIVHPSASARIRLRVYSIGGGGIERYRQVGEIRLNEVLLVYPALLITNAVDFSLSVGTILFLGEIKSKNPVTGVNTVLRGLGEIGGVTVPGVVGAEVTEVTDARRSGAAMCAAGTINCVSIRPRRSKKARSSWPMVSRLGGEHAGKGQAEGSR